MSIRISEREQFSKHTLSPGLSLGALAPMAQHASADTPFASFAFPATGPPKPRTMGDRLVLIPPAEAASSATRMRGSSWGATETPCSTLMGRYLASKTAKTDVIVLRGTPPRNADRACSENDDIVPNRGCCSLLLTNGKVRAL
jgi:hypothetical protein